MNQKKTAGLPMAVATGAAAILLLTGFGSYGALDAEVSNTTAQDVLGGTLILELDNNGKGFTNDLSELAPGDVVNRYVEITNSGTLDGDTLELQVASSGAVELIDNGTSGSTTEAVTLEITSCSVAWDSNDGNCTGTEEELQSAITLGAFNSAIVLGSGNFAVDDTKYLQMSLSLPDQDETTTNGNFPTNTVQGKSVSVTYTFGVAQRTATTTNE